MLVRYRVLRILYFVLFLSFVGLGWVPPVARWFSAELGNAAGLGAAAVYAAYLVWLIRLINRSGKALGVAQSDTSSQRLETEMDTDIIWNRSMAGEYTDTRAAGAPPQTVEHPRFTTNPSSPGNSS